MTLGEKVKELRTQSGLTQKDLADKVNVSAQAVSRWEKDIVEPDIGTLKKLSEIFSISLDILLSNKPLPSKEPNTPPIIIQHVNDAPTIDPRRQIGVCETCNKPILEGEPIHRHGFTSSRGQSKITKIMCQNCETNRISANKKLKLEKTKSNRFFGFFWSIIFSSIFVYIGFTSLFEGNLNSIYGSLIITYSIFAFFFTINAKNTFLADFFMEITSWGFVKMPGVIFSLDFDGLLFLIGAKIFLFFVGIGIALAFGTLALVLTIILSWFVFPFSLYLSFTNPERTDID